MMLIKNVEMMGLDTSIKASKYPYAIDTEAVTDEITNTVKKLFSSPEGQGHSQALTGIIVNFDLTFSVKAWTEAERYRFFYFVSSQSTMHRIAQFDAEQCVNKYVTENTIKELNRLKDIYNMTNDPEDYLRLLYNVPVGFELTARITTNYRQLKTIYLQRRNHRLPEWRYFCNWIRGLPGFAMLCLGEDK